MRLKVKIRNSKDTSTLLPFPDLCVKYTNGFSPSLKIEEGKEIPLDVLDPEDVRKSLLVGSLRGYIDNGWVEEIIEEVAPSPISMVDVIGETKKDEKQTVLIEIAPLENTPQTLPAVNLPEKEAPIPSIVVADSLPVTDCSLVKSYDDFCRLSHLLKLRFIKESTNKNLLNEIFSTTPSSQFKNNITIRLQQLQ